MNEDDSEAPIDGQFARFWLQIVLYVAIVLTYATAFRAQPQVLFALLCVTCGYFFSAFVHECGHAMTALACRWRVVAFVVRPIGIQIPNRNVAFVPRNNRIEAGGWVATVPMSSAADNRRNWTAIVAGGPIASFLLGGFVLLGWACMTRPYDGEAVNLGRILLGFGAQSLSLGALSLLPGPSAAASTDGDVLRAIGDEDEYRAKRPVIWLETLLRNNVRLGALPDWLISEVRTLSESSDELARYFARLEIGRTLDRAPIDVGSARSLIDGFRARFGADGWLCACDAYVAAVWEDDLLRAQAVLSQCSRSNGVRELSLAAEAALAARMGKSSEVRSLLKEMRRELKRASPFRNPTFVDIRRQIERLLVQQNSLSPARP